MSSESAWTADQIPDLTDLRAVVTGANTGIGVETALELARHGAHVTLACRSPERGQAALDRVRTEAGPRSGTAALAIVDLADLASVRQFAEGWQGPLDILVNNAGVMTTSYGTTTDGFELQLGTNHLGHFALTGLLLSALRSAAAARVVTVSSLGHKMGRINFEDLQWTGRHGRLAPYAQSKLANLLFTRELVRRLNRAGSTVCAVAAHPGLSDTELIHGIVGDSGRRYDLGKVVNGFIGQPAGAGALPLLRAATDEDVVPGDYLGPGGSGERSGPPVQVGMSARARDSAVGRRLWVVSEELTGVSYDLPD